VSEQNLKLCLAQLNLLVGDIVSNTQHVIQAAEQALENKADIVIFPELTLTGYPPEDLLLRSSLELRIAEAIQVIQQAALPIYIVVGYPKYKNGQLFNMAGGVF